MHVLVLSGLRFRSLLIIVRTYEKFIYSRSNSIVAHILQSKLDTHNIISLYFYKVETGHLNKNLI